MKKKQTRRAAPPVVTDTAITLDTDIVRALLACYIFARETLGAARAAQATGMPAIVSPPADVTLATVMALRGPFKEFPEHMAAVTYEMSKALRNGRTK